VVVGELVGCGGQELVGGERVAGAGGQELVGLVAGVAGRLVGWSPQILVLSL
jgi:hypothetical protein